MIDAPLFEPDKAPYLFSSSDNLLNCLPRADGWGPFPKLVTVSDPLPAECLGAIAIKDSSNNIIVFAGTSTDLYRLDTSVNPNAWLEISKVTGGYTVPTNDRWSFTEFGDYLIAHSLGDAPQYVDLTAGVTDFADLAGNPPVAKHSWVAGDFLVFGWLANEPDTVRWSGVNDAEHWVIGRRGSDSQVFPDGRGIQGGLSDERGAVIIQRDKIRNMQFNPSSGYTFTFSVANPFRGSIASHSIIQIGPGQYVYLAEDGFFTGQGQPIGAERVNRWFQENIDSSYLFDVRGFADPLEKIAWWRFRNQAGAGQLLGYDWNLDRWCYSNTDNTHAMPSISPGITWDGLDLLYATIDDVNVPYDSRLLKGGRPTFAAFNQANELGYFSGSNQAAEIQYADLTLTPERTYVSGARLITDCTDFTIQTIGQEIHGGSETTKAPQSPSSRTGYVPLRHSARLHSFKVAIPADTVWTIVSGIEPSFVAEGKT